MEEGERLKTTQKSFFLPWSSHNAETQEKEKIEEHIEALKAFFRRRGKKKKQSLSSGAYVHSGFFGIIMSCATGIVTVMATWRSHLKLVLIMSVHSACITGHAIGP